VGTLGYLPLEQFRGQVKPASDLYSLGASLLFLLTGKSPADLPQVRMKIDWRSRVKISADFAEWLDKMLEPALEERFSSARDALNALSKGKNSPRLALKNPPLSNTKVEIKGDRVTIYIAPQGWNFTRIYRFFILMLIISFFLILVLQNISNIEWSWFIFLAMFFFPLGITMSGLLRAIYGYTTIKINPETFSIEAKCMGLKKKVLQVKTIDIDKLELHVQVSPKNHQRTYSCLLWEGVRQHTFGRNLSLGVQNWLVGELSHLINLMQS
jgi:serine/threonine protein kinase